MGITVLPPDINSSALDFTPVGEAIRFGLRAIKNVGENTVKGILEAREQFGAFRSIFQFCEAVDPRLLNRRVLESLIKSGAMDSLQARRAQLFSVIDKAMDGGQRAHRERSSGQHGLFAGGASPFAQPGESGLEPVEPPLPDEEEWPEDQMLAHEYATLGFYISGHPLARHAGRFKQLGVTEIGALEGAQSGDEVILAALVANQRPMRSKKGDRWAICTLQDMTGAVELLVFPEAFTRLEGILKAGQPLLVKGRISVEEVGTRLISLEAKPLDDVVEPAPSVLRVRVDLRAVDALTLERLQELFDSKPGPCRVSFELVQSDGTRALLQSDRRVRPDRQLVEAVQEMCGPNTVEVLH
jgi:DNA polymerase-3 subunit alpha